MTRPLLQVENLTLTVPGARRGEPRRLIVDQVSFDISAGEALGLVGESGSGKSMTARAVMRLLARGVRAEGAVRFDGSDVLTMDDHRLQAIRATRIAMVFQDPRAHINPVRTIGDFLTEGRRAAGTSRTDAAAIALRLLASVGIPDGQRRLEQYPYELSGGLLQRVMIAGAMAMDPDLLLADEPTTALDVSTQSEVMAILEQLRHDRGLAMLFITHDLELAAATCDRSAVMYAGRIVETQPSASLHRTPLHPYTSGLLVSRPDIEIVQPRLTVIPGRPIAAFESPGGCSFAARCPHALDTCRSERPEPAPVADGQVACLRSAELLGSLPHALTGGTHV